MKRELLRLGSAGPENRLRRRLIGSLGLERGAQQPVTFEALHEFVRVNDSRGDCAKDIRIALHLRVQIARNARKIVESQREFLRHGDQVGVHAQERGIGVGRRQFKLLTQVR